MKKKSRNLSLKKKTISNLETSLLKGGSGGPGSILSVFCSNYCSVQCGGTIECPPKPSGGPCNKK